jgi:hypothetical protein
METNQCTTHHEGGALPTGVTQGARELPETTRVAMEPAGAALVGVGEREDQADSGASNPTKRFPTPRRDDGNIGNHDPHERLACDMLSEAFRTLARCEQRLRANPDIPSTTRGKWRLEQDEIIRFLTMDTPFHILADRTPEQCYKRGLEIIREGKIPCAT